MQAVCELLCRTRDMEGLRVLVTAGPTVERIDPVRYLTNDSSGKMGYALAQAAHDAARWSRCSPGPVQIAPPQGVSVVPSPPRRACMTPCWPAVGNRHYRAGGSPGGLPRGAPLRAEAQKARSEPLMLALVENPDIARAVGERKQPARCWWALPPRRRTCWKTRAEKLLSKHLDLIVANDVTAEGAGFGTDTNIVTLISHGGTETLPLMSKREVAHRIWDAALALRGAEHAGQ